MNKKLSTSKKDDSEEPLIDQSNEGLKKLILKGKKKGFLHRSDCEKALENEKYFIQKLKVSISKYTTRTAKRFPMMKMK